MKRPSRVLFSLFLLLLCSTPASWAQKGKVYDLGYYPGGNWAEPRGINDFGVVVGFGDIPGGNTRPIGVPLFGRNAGQWFDLGTLGGDRKDMEVMCMGVADSGMIVGHAALPDNETIHAFAWTARSSMVDIGTLAIDPNYSQYSFSLAVNVNKSGTLIVGWSNSEFGVGINSLPVVWTPKVVWSSHEPTLIWEIHKLDTTGFEQATYWNATMVNDFGQIIGTASTADGLDSAFLWNPVPGGKGWKIMRLPTLSPYSYAYANDINDRGEIVGSTTDWTNSLFPTLWKPEGPRRNAYNLTLLTTLTGLEQGWAEANGINDRGDIVGDDWSSGTATRWSTRDPSFIEVLGFPGTWSWATKVNNNRIAVGSYGSDTIWENTVAVKLP